MKSSRVRISAFGMPEVANVLTVAFAIASLAILYGEYARPGWYGTNPDHTRTDAMLTCVTFMVAAVFVHRRFGRLPRVYRVPDGIVIGQRSRETLVPYARLRAVEWIERGYGGYTQIVEVLVESETGAVSAVRFIPDGEHAVEGLQRHVSVGASSS
jgi:hypothetical protein